jgi:hypothetical protein
MVTRTAENNNSIKTTPVKSKKQKSGFMRRTGYPLLAGGMIAVMSIGGAAACKQPTDTDNQKQRERPSFGTVFKSENMSNINVGDDIYNQIVAVYNTLSDEYLFDLVDNCYPISIDYDEFNNSNTIALMGPVITILGTPSNFAVDFKNALDAIRSNGRLSGILNRINNGQFLALNSAMGQNVL